MFTLFFLVMVITTKNIDSFEGMYFVIAVVDIATVIGICFIAQLLKEK